MLLDSCRRYMATLGEKGIWSAALFRKYAEEAGLKVLEQRVIDWGQSKELDCVTLIEA